jgi:hypothetical protein
MKIPNLEEDLHNDSILIKKIQTNLEYSKKFLETISSCNWFYVKEVIPSLKEEDLIWFCTVRYAQAIVFSIRGELLNVDLISSIIDSEVESDLFNLGWIPTA